MPGPNLTLPTVNQETLNDFVATMDAKPKLSTNDILNKFPEFAGNSNLVQSARDYYATVKSGKYSNPSDINEKFPEFFQKGPDYSHGLTGEGSPSDAASKSFEQQFPVSKKPEPPKTPQDFTGGLKKYYGFGTQTFNNDLGDQYQGLNAIAAQKADADKAFFEDPKISFDEKHAKALSINKDLQDKKIALQKQQDDYNREIQQEQTDFMFGKRDPNVKPGEQSPTMKRIAPLLKDVTSQLQDIDKLQQQLGTNGNPGELSNLTNTVGANAQAAIKDPISIAGLSDDQIKENAGVTGTQLKNIGNQNLTAAEMAYGVKPEFKDIIGTGAVPTSGWQVLAGGKNAQVSGLAPLDRAVNQRIGLMQDISSLGDHIDQLNKGLEPVADQLKNLMDAYNKAPTQQNRQAYQDYQQKVYQPQADAVSAQIDNLKRFEKIAQTGFPEITAEEKKIEDLNANYEKAIQGTHGLYADVNQPGDQAEEAGFRWAARTVKGLIPKRFGGEGSLFNLFMPAVAQSTINNAEKTMYGFGNLTGQVSRLWRDPAEYESAQLQEFSEVRSHLISLPEKFTNPQFIKPAAPGGNLLDRVDWTEAGPQMLSTTMSMLPLVAATTLSGGTLAELGWVSDAAAGATWSTIPVTAGLMYGDLLHGNMEQGLSSSQAAAIATFQSLVQGVAMELNPLKGKVFNPEYYAAGDVEYLTKSGVMKSLYKSMTGQELTSAYETYLTDSIREAMGKVAGYGLKGVKTLHAGAFSLAEGVGQMVAVDLLNAPFNKEIDQHVQGYNFNPLTGQTIMDTAVNAAVTMAPLAFWAGTTSILRKQIPSFRWEIGKSPDSYFERAAADFRANKISFQTYNDMVESIQQIQSQVEGNKTLFDNLEHKRDKVEMLNMLVNYARLTDHISKLNADQLSQIPKGETESWGKIYEKQTGDYQEALSHYSKLALKNADLTTAERSAKQEELITKATKGKYTDEFIEGLSNDKQIDFFKKDLEARTKYMPSLKFGEVVNDITDKLNARSEAIKVRQEEIKKAVTVDLTPKTEDITIGDSNYRVTYNEDLSIQDLKYTNGKPVEDNDERQALVNELQERIRTTREARINKVALNQPTEGTISITTKNGTKDYQIGKTYIVGKVQTTDREGNNISRFPEITILGKNDDGTIRIKTDKNPDGIDVSPSLFADYKLGSKDAVAKNPAAQYYMDNANREFTYTFGRGNTKRGHLEYDSDKKELLFVYDGGKKNIEIREEDLQQQEGFKRAKLERVPEEGETAEQSTENKTKQEALGADKKSFTSARERALERREKLLHDLLQDKKGSIDAISERMSKIDKALVDNTTKFKAIQDKLYLLWGVHDAKDKGVFEGMKGTEVAKQLGEMIDAGRALEKEHEALSSEFDKMQERLNEALTNLATSEKVLSEVNIGNFEDALGDVFRGKMEDYKAAINRAKDFIKEKTPVLQALSDAVDTIRKVVNGIMDYITDKFPYLMDTPRGEWFDYWDKDVEHLGEWHDVNIDRLIDKSKQFNELQDKLHYAQDRIDEMQPKLKVIKQLIKKIETEQSSFNKEREAKDKARMMDKLFGENNQVSQASGDVSITNTNEEDETIQAQSERKKPIDVISSSTVTPSNAVSNAEPAVQRRVAAQNALAEPTIENGKVTSSNSIKPYHKLLIVTSDNVEALAKKFGIDNLKDILHGDKSIATVLVAGMPDGVKFLDEGLNSIGKPSADNLVYSYIPEAELQWKSGDYKDQDRYFSRDNLSAEQWEAKRAEHDLFRNNILQQIKDSPESDLTFNLSGVSNGTTVKSDPTSFHAIGGRLISPEALKAGFEGGKPLIIVPTSPEKSNPKVGAISVGGETVNMPIGRPLLRVGNDLRFLNNRKLVEGEKGVVKGLLSLLVQRAAENNSKGREFVLDQDIISSLKGFVYWRNPTEEQKADPNWSPGRNQLYLDFSEGEGFFVLGKNKIQVPWDSVAVDQAPEMDAFLNEAYNNVDINLLNPNNKIGSYLEVTSVDPEKNTYETKKWNSYAEYLLSDEGRKPGETPLGTNVDPISEEPGKANVVGRYMMFDGGEGVKKPQETIAAAVDEEGKPTFVHENTLYKQTHEPMSIGRLLGELKSPTEGKVFVTTFQSGAIARYTVDAEGRANVFGVEGTTKSIEEVNGILNEILESEKIAADKGVPGVIQINTGIFEKTDSKVETKQKPAIEPSADQRAQKRALRLKGGIERNTRLAVAREFYKTEDFKAFKGWFEKNFPDSISAERVSHLIDGVAWGQFKDNAIKIYQHAEIGTGFHEAFEAVWNTFLSPVEREAHVSEFRRRDGSFKEYSTGNSIKYKEASTDQIKEQVAEEFRNYQLTGEKFTGAVKQESWFRKIINSIRNFFFGKPGTIDEVFQRMNEAYYKNKGQKWSASIPLYKGETSYRKFNPDNLHSIQFFSEVMDGMTAFMFSRLSKHTNSIVSMLSDKKVANSIYHDLKLDLQTHYIGKGEFYEKFWDVYNTGDYDKILDHIEKYPIDQESLVLNQLYDLYVKDEGEFGHKEAIAEFKYGVDDYVKQWEKINNDYKDFIDDHKEHMEQYSLHWESSGVEEDDKETNDYAPDWLSLSAKDNSSTAVKLLIGSLVEKEMRNGKVVDVNSTRTSMPKLVDYGQTWAILLNELAGTRNIDEQLAKLQDLVPKHPDLSSLVTKLGKASSDLSEDQMKLRIQFENVFSKLRPDYYRFVYSPFYDEKNFVVGHKIYRLNSNLNNEVEKTKNGWVSSMYDKKFITTDKDGNRVLDTAKLNDYVLGSNNFENNKKWLAHIGWDFNAELTSDQKDDFNNAVSALRSGLLKEDGSVILSKSKFSTRLDQLATLYVKSKGDFSDTQHFNIEGKPQQNAIVDNFISKHAKDINSAKNLDELYATVPGLKNNAFSKGSLLLKPGGPLFDANGNRKKTIQIGISEGAKPESASIGKHESSLTLIERMMTEFSQNLNGTYLVLVPADLKTGFTFDFGHFFDKNDVGVALDDKIWNTYSEYLLDEINVIQDYNNKGIGKNIVSFNEKYNANSNLTKAQHLQLFKDILDDRLVGKITDFANKSQTRDEARAFIEGVKSEILAGIKFHVDDIANTTKQTFEDANVIGYNNKGYMQFYGVDTDALLDTFGKLTTFTESDMENVFRLRTLNYMTGNIEQFKLFFSDLIFWKDIFKRTKSFVSGAEHTVSGLSDTNEFNVWARNNLNNVSTLTTGTSLKPLVETDGKINLESRGYLPYNGKFNKITLKDVELVSQFYIDLHNAGASKEELKHYSPYKKINEADAQGGITLPALREALRRAGQWNGHQEAMYQYEMAYERQGLARGDKYAYTDPILEKLDKQLVDNGSPIDHLDPNSPADADVLNQSRFGVLKPLKAGYVINDQLLHPSLDKYSLSPMYYRLLENSENGLSMYNQMADQNVHYFIMESGNKVGGISNDVGGTNYHDVYDDEGKTLTQSFNKEENDWKYWGIQVEVPNKDYSKRGTQITKQILSNMFNDSIENAPIDSGVSDAQWKKMSEDEKEAKSQYYKLYNENKQLLTAWVESGKQNLYNKLGIREEEGRLAFSDKSLVSDFLNNNLKGTMSDNIKQAIRLSDTPGPDGKPEFYLPLDATPVADKVESILYSYIDDSVIRPKIFGGAKPQVASTFFERGSRQGVFMNADGKYEPVKDYSKLSKSEKASVKLTSNDLKFYKNENGKITGMEVYLPWYYAGTINKGNVDPALLKGVGFRIPTQSLASVENIIIKDFMPKSMGDAIVVPSEITGKAGSDFDIDKLNLYLFEYKKVGNRFKKIEFLTDKNSTADERFDNKYRKFTKIKDTLDKIIAKDKEKNELFSSKEPEIDNLWTAIFGELNDSKSDYSPSDIDEVLQEHGSSLKAYNEIAQNATQEQTDHPDSERESFRATPIIDQNSEKAIKNRYIENLQEILERPENLRNLMTPNSADTLKGLASEVEAAQRGISMDELKAEKKAELNNHARTLDPNYVAKTRQAFLSGKKGVGIVAVNATNHILNTIAGTYMKKASRSIRFDHNTVLKLERLSDGRSFEGTFPSLAFTKDKAGNWISDNISEFLNAYVDVAKDPFILSLNAGLRNSSTFLFMNKIGIPLRDISWFMNQPILTEFEKLEDVVRSYHTGLSPFFNEQEKTNKRTGEPFKAHTNQWARRREALNTMFQFDNVDRARVRPATPYSESQLKKDIEDWGKFKAGKKKEMSQAFYERQWNAFESYKQMKDLSQQMTSVIANTKYDTTQFSSLVKTRVMLERYNLLKENTLMGNLEEYMHALHIQDIKDLYPGFNQAFSTLFFSEHPKTRMVVDRALKQFMSGGSLDDVAEIGDYLNKEFTTYVINTTPIDTEKGKVALSDYLHGLFLGKNSMAKQLSNLINRTKEGTLPPYKALDELQRVPRNNENDPQSIRPWSSKFTTPELNQIYYEILDMSTTGDPELKKFKDNMVPFAMLQSGLNNSPYNFSRFLPIEDYGKITRAMFDRFDDISMSDLEPFLEQVIGNNAKGNLGEPVTDKRIVFDSSRLAKFDDLNPKFTGSTFIVRPIVDADKTPLNVGGFEGKNLGQIGRSLNQVDTFRSPVYYDTGAKPQFSREQRNAMAERKDFSFVRTRIFAQINDEQGNPMPYVDELGNLHYIYRQIPVLGDGINMKEYYSEFQKSILEKNKEQLLDGEGQLSGETKDFISEKDMRNYLVDRYNEHKTKDIPSATQANDEAEVPPTNVTMPQADVAEKELKQLDVDKNAPDGLPPIDRSPENCE